MSKLNEPQQLAKNKKPKLLKIPNKGVTNFSRTSVVCFDGVQLVFIEPSFMQICYLFVWDFISSFRFFTLPIVVVYLTS